MAHTNIKEQDNLEIDIQKAVRFLLSAEYFKEFEIIDGLNRHPQGLNFFEWLHKTHQMISKDKLDKIRLEISLEEE